MTLRAALDEALKHVDLHERDQAAVELARTYADTLDADRRRIGTVGPALLRALEELQLTPKARGAVKEQASALRSPLDELRARRAARLDPAPVVDATAP